MIAPARTRLLLLALALPGLLPGGPLRAQEPGAQEQGAQEQGIGQLPPLARASVGMRVRAEVVLRGPRLAVRPLTRADEVVLRIVDVQLAGDSLRYRLELYGLTPGRHDLARYLVQEDGTPARGLPALPVEVLSVLPAGPAEPAELPARAPPRLGGYRLLLGLAIAAWVGGLLALALVGRGRRRGPALAAPPPPPPGAAELLRPLVEDALGGRIDVAGQARLEGLILEACRERLGLAGLPAREALQRLRRDPEAGPIVVALEEWLHAPPQGDVQARARAVLERVRGGLTAAPGRPA